MKGRKRSHAGRIAAIIGDDETDAYLAIHEAYRAFTASTGARGVGGGNIDLLDPEQVMELGGDFRPGLIALAHESAGDWLCWDLRKGRPKTGAPRVVYVDHEMALAEPFAFDVRGAMVHILARAAIGTPGKEIAPFSSKWLDAFGPVVGPKERKAIARLAERVGKRPERPTFEGDEDVKRALGDLVPKGDGGWGMVPSTDVPLLTPDDPKCMDEAIERYEEYAAVFREMVHDEGRGAYAWHLAETQRGLSNLLMRRGKYARAGVAAREAIAHYEPILELGDDRIATQLAFVHHVLAVVEGRAKRWKSAYEHAERAIALSETVLVDYASGLRALLSVTDAWERERRGEKRHEVKIRLDVAARETARFVNRSPPHILTDVAARISRLAKR